MNETTIALNRVYVVRCSLFGGPADTGMKPGEGVSCYSTNDADPYKLFLPGGVGLGRKLNPDALYCACRWPAEPRSRILRSHYVVEARKGPSGTPVILHPADWGPAYWTGRMIDLSPGAAKLLRVVTDDIITFEWREGTGVELEAVK